jgi:hypothetical protein
MQDLVELSGPLLAATYSTDLAAGDAGDVERELAAIAAPDLETRFIAPDGTSNIDTGIEGFLRLWADWSAAFEHFSVEASRPPVAGATTLVNFVRQTGRLPGSDAPITSEGAAAWFFRDGRLARIEFHLRPEDALASAGLEAP